MLRYVGEEVERVKGLFDEKERRLVGEAQAAAGAAATEVRAPAWLQGARSCRASLRGKCGQLWPARQVLIADSSVMYAHGCGSKIPDPWSMLIHKEPTESFVLVSPQVTEAQDALKAAQDDAAAARHEAGAQAERAAAASAALEQASAALEVPAANTSIHMPMKRAVPVIGTFQADLRRRPARFVCLYVRKTSITIRTAKAAKTLPSRALHLLKRQRGVTGRAHRGGSCSRGSRGRARGCCPRECARERGGGRDALAAGRAAAAARGWCCAHGAAHHRRQGPAGTLPPHRAVMCMFACWPGAAAAQRGWCCVHHEADHRRQGTCRHPTSSQGRDVFLLAGRCSGTAQGVKCAWRS